MIELVYLYLSCCCQEYYNYDEITMSIDEYLVLCWMISWWWYKMWLRFCCFIIRVDFMWDHEIYIHMSFGELFVRIQGIVMSCYAYWTIGEFMSVMSIWMVNLWSYSLLWCWCWWMNVWWCMIFIWMIITYIHWWMTLHVSWHVSCG